MRSIPLRPSLFFSSLNRIEDGHRILRCIFIIADERVWKSMPNDLLTDHFLGRIDSSTTGFSASHQSVVIALSSAPNNPPLWAAGRTSLLLLLLR